MSPKNESSPKMPAKKSSAAPKTHPLQVRLDADVLEKLRGKAGPNGVAEWVRDAINLKLELAELPQPAKPKQPTHADQEAIMTKLKSIELKLATAANYRIESANRISNQLRGIQESSERSANFSRTVWAALGLIAERLGISDGDVTGALSRMLPSVDPRVRDKK